MPALIAAASLSCHLAFPMRHDAGERPGRPRDRRVTASFTCVRWRRCYRDPQAWRLGAVFRRRIKATAPASGTATPASQALVWRVPYGGAAALYIARGLDGADSRREAFAQPAEASVRP
jgi:hypothetical protein